MLLQNQFYSIGPCLLVHSELSNNFFIAFSFSSTILTRFAPELRPSLSRSGHIQADIWQRTSVAGIYAAGDVTETPQPSVPTALAQGLVAARAAERDAEQLPPFESKAVPRPV